MYVQYGIRNSEEAVIYRIYGGTPVVAVPERIEDCPVTAVGAYCFSDRSRIPGDVRCAGNKPSQSERELAGDYIQEAALPDTIRSIDNAAFFGCRNLTALEIGQQLMSIGSDVFNNCSRLRTLRVRAGAGEVTAVRHILNRISWEIEVFFEDAVVLYPEYYEVYDTIAPAHIFGLSIEGEGFRARQCFQNDVIDFCAYDDIFRKARAGETVSTLGRMALNRLMTPVCLAKRYQREYENYVRANSGEILLDNIKTRDFAKLEFICVHQYTDAAGVERAACQAARDGWAEGAAGLMEWKHQYYVVHKKNRYEFE